MRIHCVSNDSEMFIFPQSVDKRGIRPQDHPRYIDDLRLLGTGIPDCISPEHTDATLDQYRLPIGKALGGRFTEVRRFHESVGGSLGVISGRHGLIDSKVKVLPYGCQVETRRDADSLDDRTGFVESLMNKHGENEAVLVFLPRAHTEVVLERWEGGMERMIFITSPDLHPSLHDKGAVALPRRGARIGRHNIEPIEKELMMRGWCGRRDLNPSSKLGKLK